MHMSTVGRQLYYTKNCLLYYTKNCLSFIILFIVSPKASFGLVLSSLTLMNLIQTLIHPYVPPFPHKLSTLYSVLEYFFTVFIIPILMLVVYSFSHPLWILLKCPCCSYVSFNFLPLWLIPWIPWNMERILSFTLEIFSSITQLQKWARGESLSCPLSMPYTLISTRLWHIGLSSNHFGFDALNSLSIREPSRVRSPSLDIFVPRQVVVIS